MLRHLLPMMLAASTAIASPDPGELVIRDVTPLSGSQLRALQEIAATKGQALSREIASEIESRNLLQMDPRPVAVIHYQGLVNTDPRRIESVAILRQMDDLAVLVRSWQLTGNPQTASTLRKHILGWAQAYKPTGDDVNENKLYPLFVAYHGLRKTFPPDERAAVDGWIGNLAAFHSEAVKTSKHFTNRYTKHVRLLTIFGMILERDDWIGLAREGFQRFVDQSLYADGSSYDLELRDTLTYHGSALKPLLEIAMLKGGDWLALYTWTGAKGGSVKKSVDYVRPFATGEKVREEWKNSKVDLDRRRASAGVEHYRPGRPYDPLESLELMERASYFDPSLGSVIAGLMAKSKQAHRSWYLLVVDAVRRSQENQR